MGEHEREGERKLNAKGTSYLYRARHMSTQLTEHLTGKIYSDWHHADQYIMVIWYY